MKLFASALQLRIIIKYNLINNVNIFNNTGNIITLLLIIKKSFRDVQVLKDLKKIINKKYSYLPGNPRN